MANKRSIELRVQEDRAKTLLGKKRILRIYPLISLVITVILLLLMLTNWAAIYNTDLGDNEIEVTGFQCVSAGLSDNYDSIDQSAFGDMAVFSYHAESYVRSLSVVSVVALFVVIVHLLIGVFALITNKQGAFNILDLVFIASKTALFIACYAIAISMNDSGILTTYCNNNPACSVQSHAILPALFALLSLAVPIVAMIHSAKIKRETDGVAESGADGAATPAPRRKFGRKYKS